GTLLHWPSWYPQAGSDPVLAATLTVEAPASFPVRYRAQHLDVEPDEREEGGRRRYHWAASFLARDDEPLGPGRWDRAPAVHFATDRFEVDGHAGSLRSWEEFGAWYRDLSAGRDGLPEAARAEVAELVAGVTDPRERVRRLYGHLQATTRYVSVQLGLGGWVPFDAAYVYERRYGDCKALTNYLRALLREAGIEAYPALIAADRPDLDPEFVSNRFNHVILFVPLGEEEPVWLEATSQTRPFGQLGPGTEGRHALVVTPQGGRLLRTPTRPAAANAQFRTAAVTLHADGRAEADATTRFTGHQLAQRRGGFVRASPDERADWLRREIDLPGLTLHGAAFEGLDAADTTLAVSARFTAERFGTALGRRLLLTPNLMERWSGAPPASPGRTQPVEAFEYPFLDVDTVRYTLPRGYVVEALSQPEVLETDFARYEATLTEADGTLVYVRRIEIVEPRLPAARYDDFRSFTEAVARADAQQVVLVRE
ncbi:MAG: transglutaminase domain-containing protein, partial [Rhodothermales bacterium]|nr:transglutaminase domain-containing protein [Rhodothermales bacterium]